MIDEVADFEIALVAAGDAVAQSYAVGPGTIEHRHHQCTALADEADRTITERVGIEHDRRAQGHLVVRYDHAHAVRSEDAHAAAGGEIDDGRLPVGPMLIHLGEAGRDDDAAADPGIRRFHKVVLQSAARHREDRDVGSRRQRGDRGVGLAAKDLLLVPVDREQLAGEAVLDQEARDAPAEFCDIVGRAQHGDGPRMKDSIHRQAGGCAILDKMRCVKGGSHFHLVQSFAQLVAGKSCSACSNAPRNPSAADR